MTVEINKTNHRLFAPISNCKCKYEYFSKYRSKIVEIIKSSN